MLFNAKIVCLHGENGTKLNVRGGFGSGEASYFICGFSSMHGERLSLYLSPFDGERVSGYVVGYVNNCNILYIIFYAQ